MTLYSFPTLTDLLEHVESLPKRGDRSDDEWCGGGCAAASRLARYGWPEGTKRASAMAGRIADRVVGSQSASSTEPVIGYDVTGAAYDPGAYCGGVPECWSTLEPVESRRSIRIVLDNGVSCGVPESAIENRGIAVTALAMALQARGYSVTVDVCNMMNTRDGWEVTIARILDADSGSPIDIDRLVYAAGHPSSARSLYRAVIDECRDDSGATKWGSAYPSQSTKPEVDLGEYDLFFGGAHLADVCRWKDGGEKWVLDQFNKQTEG